MEMCPPLQVLPLTLLLVSGLYLFVLPYATKRRQRATPRLQLSADLMCIWRLST